MRVAVFCFVVAACAALVGMSLGIAMGMAQDFQLAPVHAHVNLLGWVTMTLYGLYHRGVERPSDRLAWVQVSAAAIGFPMMTGGLAHYLYTGVEGAAPFIIAGSLLTVSSMILFLSLVVLDFLRARKGAADRARDIRSFSRRPASRLGVEGQSTASG